MMEHNLHPFIVRDMVRVRKYLRKKMPVGIILDGASGSGKTTLAVQLLELFQDKRIDYSLQYAMGGKDFVKKFRLCYDAGLRVIIYDESGDYSSGASFSQFNRMMDEFFDKFRTFNTLVIFCLPVFWKLPSSLFDKKIPKWLLNVSRNIDDEFAVVRSYNLYRIEHMRYYLRKDKIRIKSQVYDKVEPNYGGDVTGPVKVFDLSPDRSAELDKICTVQKSSDVFRIGSDLLSLSSNDSLVEDGVGVVDDFVVPDRLLND